MLRSAGGWRGGSRSCARAGWCARGASPTSAFFTLGAASYLDNAEEYATRARELNPVLRDGFAGLYARIAEFLSARLRAPVGFADGLALPGVHIWLAPAIFV